MTSSDTSILCSVSIDDYDDILYTPLPPRTPSPLRPDGHSSSQTYSTWSSASQITHKSVCDLPSVPAVEDHHVPLLQLPSFNTPSMDFHFTPPNTVSEMSLLTWGWVNRSNSSMESVSIYSSQDQHDLSYLPLHKFVFDEDWETDKWLMTSNWVSGLGTFQDNVKYMASPYISAEPISFVRNIGRWLQNIRWRLTKRQTSIKFIKRPVYECDTPKQNEDKDLPSCSGSKKQVSLVKTIRKRMQKFCSRIFVCGKPSLD